MGDGMGVRRWSRVARGALVVGFAGAALAAAALATDQVERPGGGRSMGPAGEGPGVPGGRGAIRSGRGPEAPLALGTLTVIADEDPTCPEGFSCTGFEVACPDVQGDARGSLAVADAEGRPRGLVLFASGGFGGDWWARGEVAADFLEDLRGDGFVLVQLRWEDAWLAAAGGEEAGPARLACRPATVVKWAHENLYEPLGLDPGAGECGFCITGNSGGASQVSYTLSHYGLEDILDAVIPTSGPPHAALRKGCLRKPWQEAYWYEDRNARTIDVSYGYKGVGGPCFSHDRGFGRRWKEDSVDTGGSDYVHPETRVHLILGGRDGTVAPDHALDYAARLEEEGTPLLTVEWVPEMSHPIVMSAEGLAALRDALLGEA